jgi:CRISPR/Cas system CSM-associated protein Csm3 (group 7 of RAMP superfamily)
VFVGDARPDAASEEAARAAVRRQLRLRHGVGLDRRLRTVTPQVLFEREVLDAPDLQLVAPLAVEEVSDEAWALLRRALPLVTGVGNSRTRGLGRIRVELTPEPRAEARATHAFPSEAPASRAAIVEIEALEPLVLGGFTPVSNLVESLSVVSGAALRGAFGTAAARVDTGPSFQRVFVDPTTCLLFSDACPAPAGSGDLPVPVPRSSLACKHQDRGNHRREARAVPVDGLLAAALAPYLAERHGGGAHGHPCAICGVPLRTARGTWPRVELTRRVVTRLARDVHTGSAMPQMLYSMAQIEAGARFAGTVARLSPEALRWLHELAGAEIRIGRGRRRGLGRVRITIREAPEILGASAVQARAKQYDDAVRDALPLLGERLGMQARGAIAVLARTDLDLPPNDAPARLRDALFGEGAARARCAVEMQARGVRSGWSEGRDGDGKVGPRPLRPVVLAGSAWLFVHEGGGTLDMAELARLETEGVGERRELGLGRLAIGHALFVK